MTSFVSHPHNCKRSLPLNSCSMLLFPADGSYSALNYKQVHMPNLKESKFPDKNRLNVYIHHVPKTVPCTGWGKTHSELVIYWTDVNENSWGWKRMRREKTLGGFSKEKEDEKESRKKISRKNLWKQLFLLEWIDYFLKLRVGKSHYYASAPIFNFLFF